MRKIAVVVPTIRPEQLELFKEAWEEQFNQYDIDLYIVTDGEYPTVNGWSIKQVMGEYSDLIYNKTDAVRNLGFALAYKNGAEIIITLDDDTRPFGDTIGDHLRALNARYPVSWLNTTDEVYMRGFPYSVRSEAPCVLSHGMWQGVADFDASTQLVMGTPALTNRRMPVPKGILFPMCIMNVAFKRCMVPYMYQAPMGHRVGLDRFADIWGGIEAKRAIDEQGWAAVTGYATVRHERASDPFANLVKEAKGVGMNEKYGEDEYFLLFNNNIKRWQKYLEEL